MDIWFIYGYTNLMFQPLHFTGVRVIPLQQDDGHTELQVEVILQPEGGGTAGGCRWQRPGRVFRECENFMGLALGKLT